MCWDIGGENVLRPFHLEMLSGILQNSLGHTLLKRLLSKNGGGEAGANTPELISMPDEDS